MFLTELRPFLAAGDVCVQASMALLFLLVINPLFCSRGRVYVFSIGWRLGIRPVELDETAVLGGEAIVRLDVSLFLAAASSALDLRTIK